MRKRLDIVTRLPHNAIGAEVGVWKGDFSEILLEYTKPKELHLVDPWLSRPDLPDTKYGKEDQDYMDRLYLQVITEFPECIIHRETSLEAAKKFPDGYFDWVYLDGDHEDLKRDIEAWLPKTKLLCGDDYQKGAVRRDLEGYNHKVLEQQQWMIIDETAG